MEGCVQFLSENHPAALAYAQRNRFSQKQIADLSAVLNITKEHNLDIQPHEVVTHSQIDNGSFGSIFKATYRGKVVVFKRVEQGSGSGNLKEIIRDIYFELNAAVHVRHPCVVGFEGLLSSFPKEGSRDQRVEMGFIFEYCDNGNVYANIFEKRTLERWQSRLKVACEVAAGMEHIHSQNFIHRDLNSQNVVLTRDMHAKICDFGAARKIGPSGTFLPLMIEGSPSTMSPEQLIGDHLSLKSDVWQMGVFLWEIFSLRHPWVGVCDINNHLALTELIVKRGMRLPPLEQRDLPPVVHKPLRDLIQQTFEVKVDRRPDMHQAHTVLTRIQSSTLPQSDKSSRIPQSFGSDPKCATPRKEQGKVDPVMTAMEAPRQIFKIGDEVEYLSTSYGGWIPARVIKFNANGTLELDVRSDVTMNQVRPVTAVPAADLPEQGPKDEIVEAETVEEREPSEDLVQIHENETSQPDKRDEIGPEIERVLVPEPEPFPVFDKVIPVVSNSAFHIGEEVEYFSYTYGEWITAIVQSFNLDGTIELDVKSEASPHLVRRKNVPLRNGQHSQLPKEQPRHETEQRNAIQPATPRTLQLRQMVCQERVVLQDRIVYQDRVVEVPVEKKFSNAKPPPVPVMADMKNKTAIKGKSEGTSTGRPPAGAKKLTKQAMSLEQYSSVMYGLDGQVLAPGFASSPAFGSPMIPSYQSFGVQYPNSPYSAPQTQNYSGSSLFG